MPARPPSLLFLGSHSGFSTVVLKHLLAAGPALSGVVVASPGRPAPAILARRATPIPVAQAETVVSLAQERGIPVLAVGGLAHADTLERLAAFRPHRVVAACFPFILPRALLSLPRLGCLNLHPSLLPAYRGPSPLFWQLRAGATETGVTLHRMTERVDAGGIIAQRRLPLAAGEVASQIMRRLAEAGSELLAGAIGSDGARAHPVTPQDESRSSAFGWPRDEDFRVPVSWSAERAYRFMAGTQEWRRPYAVLTRGRTLVTARAIGVAGTAAIGAPYERVGEELWIRFSPGVLRVARGEIR